jgi:hypothetical protein
MTAAQASERGTLSLAASVRHALAVTLYASVAHPVRPGFAPSTSSAVAMFTPLAAQLTLEGGSQQEPVALSPPMPPTTYSVSAPAAKPKRVYFTGMAGRVCKYSP